MVIPDPHHNLAPQGKEIAGAILPQEERQESGRGGAEKVSPTPAKQNLFAFSNRPWAKNATVRIR